VHSEVRLNGAASVRVTGGAEMENAMASAWVVRSGRYGERDQWALDHACTGGGWKEVPDLSSCTTREDVANVARTTWPTASDALINNYTGQLSALRFRVKQGDLIAMPMKTTKKIALGRASGGYTYHRDESELDKRHVVPVEWIRTDLPRTTVKQDLLFSLGSSLSVFAPSKNNAVARLESLLVHGVDPGTLGRAPSTTSAEVASEQAVDEPEMSADISEVALDQITARIAEEFAGHGLAALVAAVLSAEGYQCTVSPPGPDGGIDISAGKGPLGLDSPRLLVQVKSGAQIGAPVVSQLHGVMSTYGAEQGLLVAWGGLSKPARDALKNQQMRVRVWEASDVVEVVLRNYDQLSSDIRTVLPLRQVWMLSETTL